MLIRQRAPHTKSRGGCTTCKKRHLRCDQTIPTCTNCQKAERPCQYENAARAAPKFRRFQPVLVADNYTPRPRPGPVEEWQASLEYFYLRGLPILKSCRPSPLWDYLVTQLSLRESSLREIATAVGQQQRVVDGAYTCQSAVEEAAALRTRAIRSLSKSIQITHNQDRSHTDDAEAYILSCLLMCILESLRGVSADLLVHLRCGIAMAHQQQRMSHETREAAQLLRQCAAGLSIFNTYSEHALDLQSKLSLQPLKSDDESNHLTDYSLANELDALILGTMQLMTECWRLSMTVISPELLTEYADMRYHLLRRQSRLIERLDIKIRAVGEGRDTEQAGFLGLSKACCILVGLYLHATWTARQLNYDSHKAEFRQVVDLAAQALNQMHNTASTEETAPARRAFSIGLPIQAILTLASTQCRDHDIRWRAFSLLDLCPRYEGAYDLRVVKAICRAVINFGEAGIESDDKFIPESRRVHYYHLSLASSSSTEEKPTLTLCHRGASEVGFDFHQMILEPELAI